MHYNALSITTAGFMLGLSAGIAPGPLLSLVITECLSAGLGAGIRVALSPLLSDAPVIILCMVLLGTVDSSILLGSISLAGAFFVLYLAHDTWTARLPTSTEVTHSNALSRGVTVNLLSPHPYLFWITVGSPFLASGLDALGPAGPALFLLGFYLALVGAKVGVALAVARSSRILRPRSYSVILKGMAAVLALFALFLLRDAYRLIMMS